MPMSSSEHRHWIGSLPVMDNVKTEAKRRKIALLVLPTTEAIEELKKHPDETNAILHVTC